MEPVVDLETYQTKYKICGGGGGGGVVVGGGGD